MIGCKITRPQSEFDRVYWENTQIGHYQLRGMATPEELRSILPDGSNLEILIGRDKIVVCVNGELKVSVNYHILEEGKALVILVGDEFRCPMTIGNLTSGRLHFEIEAVDSDRLIKK